MSFWPAVSYKVYKWLIQLLSWVYDLLLQFRSTTHILYRRKMLEKVYRLKALTSFSQLSTWLHLLECFLPGEPWKIKCRKWRHAVYSFSYPHKQFTCCRALMSACGGCGLRAVSRPRWRCIHRDRMYGGLQLRGQSTRPRWQNLARKGDTSYSRRLARTRRPSGVANGSQSQGCWWRKLSLKIYAGVSTSLFF